MSVDAGGDVTRLENDNTIFVTVALHMENPDVVEYLLDLGADPCVPMSVDAQERHGVGTIVELAKREASFEVYERLVAAVEGCPTG